MKINISEIREQVNKCLPDYLIPSYMMQINSIPVTQNGKLEKANIELSVEDIYKYATIEKLSQLITNQSGDYINIMVTKTKKKMTFHVNKDEKILKAHPFNDILY